MINQLKINIEEIECKITVLHKRMAELRTQFLLLETELIGLKLSKDKLEEQLRRNNLNR